MRECYFRDLNILIGYLLHLRYPELGRILNEYLAIALAVNRVPPAIHFEEIHILLHLQLKNGRYLQLRIICQLLRCSPQPILHDAFVRRQRQSFLFVFLFLCIVLYQLIDQVLNRRVPVLVRGNKAHILYHGLLLAMLPNGVVVQYISLTHQGRPPEHHLQLPGIIRRHFSGFRAYDDGPQADSERTKALDLFNILLPDSPVD